ncbi:MAG: hypothetical protein AB8B83_03855 [Bdellovibrionales bacterium]
MFYMVYVVGTIGFFSGFVLGIFILSALLKDRSRRELLEDRGLKWTYGVFAWIIAAITAYAAVQSYNMYLVE